MPTLINLPTRCETNGIAHQHSVEVRLTGGRSRLSPAPRLDGDRLRLFGYHKWFEYEAQVLIAYISNGPPMSWMYPVFGPRGASWFRDLAEWLRASSSGSEITFVMTLTIIPFMPKAAAGGFPVMTGNSLPHEGRRAAGRCRSTW